MLIFSILVGSYAIMGRKCNPNHVCTASVYAILVVWYYKDMNKWDPMAAFFHWIKSLYEILLYRCNFHIREQQPPWLGCQPYDKSLAIYITTPTYTLLRYPKAFFTLVKSWIISIRTNLKYQGHTTTGRVAYWHTELAVKTWPPVTNFITLYHHHLDSSYFILLIESFNINTKHGCKLSRTHRHWKGGMLVSPI